MIIFFLFIVQISSQFIQLQKIIPNEIIQSHNVSIQYLLSSTTPKQIIEISYELTKEISIYSFAFPTEYTENYSVIECQLFEIDKNNQKQQLDIYVMEEEIKETQMKHYHLYFEENKHGIIQCSFSIIKNNKNNNNYFNGLLHPIISIPISSFHFDIDLEKDDIIDIQSSLNEIQSLKNSSHQSISFNTFDCSNLHSFVLKYKSKVDYSVVDSIVDQYYLSFDVLNSLNTNKQFKIKRDYSIESTIYKDNQTYFIPINNDNIQINFSTPLTSIMAKHYSIVIHFPIGVDVYSIQCEKYYYCRNTKSNEMILNFIPQRTFTFNYTNVDMESFNHSITFSLHEHNDFISLLHSISKTIICIIFITLLLIIICQIKFHFKHFKNSTTQKIIKNE